MKWQAVENRMGRYRYMQVALNGRWEAAKVIPQNGLLSSELLAWLVDCTDVALELFFEDIGFGEAFLGVRLEETAVIPPQDLITAIQMELAGAGVLSLHQAVALLRQHISEALFGQPCEFVEVGVVNAWLSTGACLVWCAGETVPTKARLEQKLSGCPQILQEQDLPIAAEFASTTPMPHWLGIPAAEKRDNTYIVSYNQLLQLITQLYC